MLRAALETLRPWQWVKNLFVAAPLLFAKRLLDPGSLVRSLSAVAIFCALSGAVYTLNDLLDADRDRAHPRKRHRPIASGRLSAGAAATLAAGLAAVGLGAAAWLGARVAACAAAYVLLNLAYSSWLKHVVFLDVGAIAAGFLLRVLAGAAALPVPPSRWLLLCTALLASFLGFGKRAHELATTGDDEPAQRAVLARYQLHHLRAALALLGAATVAAYVLYTRARHTVEFFGTERMLWTSPFIAFGIVRFLGLVRRAPRGESPTDEMLRDGPFLLNLALWAAAVTAVIYSAHP